VKQFRIEIFLFFQDLLGFPFLKSWPKNGEEENISQMVLPDSPRPSENGDKCNQIIKERERSW
jgi:hypothetical protein